MKNPTIVRSRLRRWFAGFAVVLGAVLVQLTFAAPAHSGDLGVPGYGPGYYGGYGPGYYGGYAPAGYGCGYHCGCGSPCGCGQPCGCGSRCYPSYGGNILERRYVVRSYYERRYVNCCGGYGPYGYGNGGYGYGGYYPSAYADVVRPPYPIPYEDGYGYGNGY